MATRADKGNTWAREQGNRGTREQVNKAIGEQENRGRREQSSLCTDTPSPQKKIGKRDVCESPSLIVFRCIFAYFFCCFSSGGWKSVDRATRLWTLVIYNRVCYALEDFNTYMFDFCCFDMGSTVYISSQRFHAGVDLFDDFEKVSREESFTSNQQESKLYFSSILRVMTGTCDIVHKLAKNFHAMFIYKRWFLNRRTRNWCSRHQYSHFTCLFPRAQIQANVY